MRKLALIGIGVAGLALAATVVWGKEEPGSRATFGQRVSSLFGMIDTAEEDAPPAPPGMPPVGTHRHAHGPSVMPFSKRSTTPKSTTHSSGVPAAGTTSGALPHGVRPKPPEPKRTAGFSQAADTPDQDPAADSEFAQPRPSLLMQSRNAGTNARPATPTAPTQRTTVAPRSPSSSSTNADPQSADDPQSVPLSKSAAEAPPPVVSSRRRPQGSSVPEFTTTGGTANTEAFVPTLPPTSAASTTTLPSPTVANPQMSIAPVHTTPPSGTSLPAASLPSIGASPAISGPSLTAAPAPTFISPSTTTAASVSPAQIAPTTAQVATRTSANVPGLLASFNSPEITVETLGPARIAVGRNAEFKIVVRNRGTVEARDVLVGIGLPEWAEVEDLRGTSGHDASADSRTADGALQWQIDSVAPRSQEEVTVVLVPRRNEAFDLSVRWTCSPATAKASIEVEQPQLQMAINGPTEVSYGEQRLYKLIVSNPGNGAAENVVLHLMPLSPGDGDAVSHNIGTLKAGESTTVEVELTARQAGTLKIRTEATADGGLRAEAAADVTVRRAALEVVAAAPRMLFAGVPGTYEVRVRNVGDDAARNVRLTVDLPPGAKLLSASPQVRTDAKVGPLVWSFDRLTAGAEQVCVVKCALEHGGVQQLTAAATADGDLRKTAQAATEVQAVADLALDVVDTAGPVAVGQPVVYEIKVKNRGMKGAEGVDVVAYFSEGIEPEKAEGQGYELQPGMVVFKSLPSVGANQERVLKVVARASTAGNHRLRVELRSAAPPTQLSHEDSTFFYADETATGAALQAPAALAAPATMTPPSATPIRPTSGMAPASGAVMPLRTIAPAGAAASGSVAPAGGAATVYPTATANRPAVVPYYAPTGR